MREAVTDLVSLAAGGVVVALGTLVLLDSAGALDLSLGWMAVVLTGAIGALLLFSGLAGGTGDRHD